MQGSELSGRERRHAGGVTYDKLAQGSKLSDRERRHAGGVTYDSASLRKDTVSVAECTPRLELV